MQFNTFSVIILMGLFGLSGCEGQTNSLPTVPTASLTTGALPTPASCLVGIWEINDKESFLRALIPPGAFDPADLNLKNVVGSVAYRFDNQGILTVEAVTFQGVFDVKTDRDISSLEIKMEGFAVGGYQLEGDLVDLTEMKSSDMVFNASYSGEEMMTDVKADGFLPLFVAQYDSARIDCNKENLTLSFFNNPNIPKPLEFKRLR